MWWWMARQYTLLIHSATGHNVPGMHLRGGPRNQRLTRAFPPTKNITRETLSPAVRESALWLPAQVRVNARSGD